MKAGVVGRLTWDGCDGCKHYPPERGGCDIDAPDDIENFDLYFDHVVCRRFEAKRKEEP